MRGYPQVGYRGGSIARGYPGFQDIPAMHAAVHGARAAWLLARFGSHIGTAITVAMILNEGYDWYVRKGKTTKELLDQFWTGTHTGPCGIQNWSVPHHCFGAGQFTPCASTSANLCNNTPVNSVTSFGNYNPVSNSVIVHESWTRSMGDLTWEEIQVRTRPYAVPFARTETIIDRKRWKKPWYLEENGWTWGMPFTTAGYHPWLLAPPRAIALPTTPPPDVREIKVRVNQVLAPLRAIIHATSEAADAIEALYKALPPCARGKEFGPQRKMRAVLRYLVKVANNPQGSISEMCGNPSGQDRDLRNAAGTFFLHAWKNLLIEGLIDAAYGIPGSWVARMSREMGIPFGLQSILKAIKNTPIGGVS